MDLGCVTAWCICLAAFVQCRLPPFALWRQTRAAAQGLYRDGGFGTSTGLMIQENRLLARALIVVDKEGVIRYLEIVPDLGQLPNMKKAFQLAGSL